MIRRTFLRMAFAAVASGMLGVELLRKREVMSAEEVWEASVGYEILKMDVDPDTGVMRILEVAPVSADGVLLAHWSGDFIPANARRFFRNKYGS